MLVASQDKEPQLHKSHLGYLLSYHPDPDPDRLYTNSRVNIRIVVIRPVDFSSHSSAPLKMEVIL